MLNEAQLKEVVVKTVAARVGGQFVPTEENVAELVHAVAREVNEACGRLYRPLVSAAQVVERKLLSDNLTVTGPDSLNLRDALVAVGEVPLL